MNLCHLQGEPALGGWRARLALRYQRMDSATRLTGRHHSGPLLVQKAFYPEGSDVCHSVLLHPPGGIAGADRLDIDVALGDGTRVVITTPGAAKWYRSAGLVAEQHVTLSVGTSASLEWLPQENIIFN